MTNYEKLCEAVGINPCEKCISQILCSELDEKHPDFTAEKQIKIIKLISDSTIQTIEIDKTGNYYNVQTSEYDTSLETDFSEALAGLALRLVEAGELDKEEVRRILE